MDDKDKNKEEQFTRAYDEYSDAIFRHCYYRVFDREKAKDFAQEAFFRTWKYIIKGNNIENIRAFLYKTANNIIIDESRKSKSLSLDNMMEKGFSPKVDDRGKAENYFDSKEIIKIINSLDEKYRDVIIMRYVDGFSQEEIASITGRTKNNVYVMVHRGCQKIKEMIEKRDYNNFKNKIK